MLLPSSGELPEVLSAKELDDNTRHTPLASARVAPEPAAAKEPQPEMARDKRIFRRAGDNRVIAQSQESIKAKPTAPRGLKRFKLYQILSPKMAHRGQIFGSTLALKDEWAAVDASYFEAPGKEEKEMPHQLLALTHDLLLSLLPYLDQGP